MYKNLYLEFTKGCDFTVCPAIIFFHISIEKKEKTRSKDLKSCEKY